MDRFPSLTQGAAESLAPSCVMVKMVWIFLPSVAAVRTSWRRSGQRSACQCGDTSPTPAPEGGFRMP